MNYLLFGGTQAVGKSNAIYRLALWLKNKKNFKVLAGILPASFSDFSVIMSGLDKNGNEIIVIINAATDTEELIDRFKKFMTDHNFKYHAVISSIRDKSYDLRQYFITTFNLSKTKDVIAEIPLAKINKNGNNYDDRFKWYEEQIDELAIYLLANNPFNI
ncbi:hypothetical protein [Flavobacterium sp.]|uniref:hypothetical protein n=1 Tax=Flavobacterium sp. TaxID=239 RepID=UPI0039E704AC